MKGVRVCPECDGTGKTKSERLRDPAAELAEALKDVLNLDWEHYILSDRVPERREAANEVVESAEAALAAYEASRK